MRCFIEGREGRRRERGKVTDKFSARICVDLAGASDHGWGGGGSGHLDPLPPLICDNQSVQLWTTRLCVAKLLDAVNVF